METILKTKKETSSLTPNTQGDTKIQFKLFSWVLLTDVDTETAV